MKNQKGFTLIELIVYIAVVGIVLTAFTTFSLRLAKTRAKTRIVGEVEYNAKLIQDRVSDAVRHAELIVVGSSTFGSDPGILTLDMVDVSQDNTVFSLDVDDGTFQVNVASVGEVPITTDAVSVSNLVFTNLTSVDDVGIIQLQFTVEAINNSGDATFDYVQSFQTTLRIPLDQD